jgi:3-dehydroquinate dehydratase-2
MLGVECWVLGYWGCSLFIVHCSLFIVHCSLFIVHCSLFLIFIRNPGIIMRIAIINGPNLNLLGRREPDVYGQESFESFLPQLLKKYSGHEISYFQSNVEGELVNEIQRVGFDHDGIILNPGAYTHTSVAIGDAVAAVTTPVVEVHISNVHAREEFRRLSHVSGKVAGTITGLGLKGYELALEWLVTRPGK